MTISADAPHCQTWADGNGAFYANVPAALKFPEERAQELIAQRLQDDYDTYVPSNIIRLEPAPALDWPDGPGLPITVPPDSLTYREPAAETAAWEDELTIPTHETIPDPADRASERVGADDD